MRVINFLVGVVLPAAAFIAWLWFAHTKANETNTALGLPEDSFGKYALGWLGSFTKSETGFETLLPATPDGWTTRTLSNADVAALTEESGLDLLLPKLLPEPLEVDGKVPPGQLSELRSGWGGPKGVVILGLSRLDDTFFTTPDGLETLALRQEALARIAQKPLLNIAGLAINEVTVSPEVPARLLLADLGQQITLRLVAPKTMSDQELRDFLSTLNVAGLNALLVSPISGMGEVAVAGQKVALLTDPAATDAAAGAGEAEAALALAEAQEGFAREEARIAELRAAIVKNARDEAAAAAAKNGEGAEDQAPGVGIRRGIGDDSGRSTLKTNGSTGFNSGCEEVGGRKVCGVIPRVAE
ncbi:hypothetical protein HOY34_08140 [Xinfangfangia sp. D13-10-4-6]|uniref:hypothetical protein n=1 Tax=Pseudogemmobacter hezensis TaxID=2737662 RepID=UPI0015575DC6|nr:hypothetical protein [Pseudogemmobacter hezensis]NPD15170.1 hypothetical protein [Pseudogemmobacter hezensis]